MDGHEALPIPSLAPGSHVMMTFTGMFGMTLARASINRWLVAWDDLTVSEIHVQNITNLGPYS